MQKYTNLSLSNSRAPQGAGFGKCSVFAFTSCSRGEGVSYVVESFGTEIAQMTGHRTLVADVDRLMNIDIDHYSRIGEFCMKTNVTNLWSLPEKNVLNGDGGGQELVLSDPNRPTSLQTAFNNLVTLRFAFDYILLDCASMNTSGDAALIAPEADGVIVVVEAEKTRKAQIKAAKKSIMNADGNFLGFILNKRKYPVPDWIYNRL